jgi:hypothetical protein
MKIDKGLPLDVTFTHINNDGIKKTIARATITCNNVPEIILNRFLNMFCNTVYPEVRVKICAETICKDTDTYDERKGEIIARKKLMKKFMSMIKQASKEQLNYYSNKELECIQLYNFAGRCKNDIIEFLKKE